MRRLHLVASSIGVLCLGLAPAAQAGVTPPLPSIVTSPTVSQFPATAKTESFAVYDASGQLVSHASWLVTPAGGNCCEDYVASQPNGRLLTFGGTYPMYSDNGGKKWYEVKPITPLNNGEGAIVPGPGGDIAGIGWDAYSGDHLQSFHYDAANGTWAVAEVPLKNPFFDRPWITIARGPFTIDGEKVPFVYVVRGGTANKDPELVSTDGLTYTQFTSPALDEAMSSTTSGPTVPVSRYGLADYWAPHPWAGTIPLSGGGLLQITQPNDGDFASCPVSAFSQSLGSWDCSKFAPPGIANVQTDTEVCCQVRQDSRGWLSDVLASGTSNPTALTYQLSTDGGKTWSAAATLKPPTGGTLEAGNVYNTAVNGRRGIAAVSARFDNAAGDGQDMVFVVDIKTPQPRLLYTLLLGKGDISTANNAGGSGGNRFDYASVAVLPSGQLAASFDDSTTYLDPETTLTQTEFPIDTAQGKNEPNLAILQTPLGSL